MCQNAVKTTIDIVVEYLTAWTCFIETSTASVETTIMGKLKSINHQIETLSTDLKVDFQRFEAENVESENMLKDLNYKMKHLFNRISGWEKEVKDDNDYIRATIADKIQNAIDYAKSNVTTKKRTKESTERNKLKPSSNLLKALRKL
jgi:D-alanyl-D-alanine dipeptidase